MSKIKLEAGLAFAGSEGESVSRLSSRLAVLTIPGVLGLWEHNFCICFCLHKAFSLCPNAPHDIRTPVIGCGPT